MRDAIDASRIAPRSLNLCNNARMMIDIALAGGGVGIFPEPMVRGEVARGALVELAGMPPPAPVEFHVAMRVADTEPRSEEHTSELQSLMRNSYAVFCLKKKRKERLHNTSE